MIVAKYKFNPNTYSNLIPEFNSAFTSYTKSDTTNSDGTITRTIESDSLPTKMRFGQVSVSGENGATDKSKSLLEIIDVNTSNLTDATDMFRYCINLTTIISNWDTSQVTNMDSMFQNCTSLTSLNLNSWNTSKVTNMHSTFNNCNSLTSLDVSNWDTSKVTDMGWMFYDCTNLTSLDISNFNTDNVVNIKSMFGYCSSLRKVAFKYANKSTISKIHENLPDRSSTTKGYILSLISLTLNKNWEILKTNYKEFYLPQPLRKVGDVKDRFYWDEDKGHYCIEQHITSTLEVLETPIIIDLPHLNKKFTFDSYAPSTSIDIPNISLKPSKVYLDAPIARYRCKVLKPSTQYNVQFDCKGDSGIKVNLGGTEVTFTPTSEWTRKNLTITTPSELVNDKLSISNVGITSNNKVDNVMLFSEVIAQEPDYIDGIQSIGEFIESDTVKYKIEIETYDSRWDSI